MTVLVTGGSGFLGRHVVAELLRRSVGVRVAVRRAGTAMLPVSGVEIVRLSGSGCAIADWADAVGGCKTVIHLAARAHVARDVHKVPVSAFHLANVDFARACAASAASAGVARFIFMSSIGVHGGASGTRPFHASSDLAPHTLCARSKFDAERALAKALLGSGMALKVIRPPLVYGPEAPSNFGALV